MVKILLSPIPEAYAADMYMDTMMKRIKLPSTHKAKVWTVYATKLTGRQWNTQSSQESGVSYQAKAASVCHRYNVRIN